MRSILWVAEYRSANRALNSPSASSDFDGFFASPSIFCGSSMMRIGRFAAITSIGLRDWKSSSTS